MGTKRDINSVMTWNLGQKKKGLSNLLNWGDVNRVPKFHAKWM